MMSETRALLSATRRAAAARAGGRPFPGGAPANPAAAARQAARLQRVPRRVAGMAALYPDASTSTRHAHERAQFILGLSGVTTMLTEAGSFVVPPGYGLWIPAGVVHQSRSWDDVEMQTVYVDAAAVPAHPASPRLMQCSALLRALMDEVLRLPALYDEEGRDGRLVDLLLSEIARMPEAALHVPIPREPRLRRACETFLAETGSDRRLDDWAALAGMSRRSLTRLFRRETGLSVSAWQQKVRLLEALARLGGGEAVTRVALDIGYDSPSAFTAMFRRSLGTCPRSYLSWSRVGALAS